MRSRDVLPSMLEIVNMKFMKVCFFNHDLKDNDEF